jgi:Na+-translocating ferredoxin:NAD+ oxidoreductase subunit B
MQSLADRVDALLPQTQCTRCGYQGCRPYAQALAANEADINQCPPGGAAGIVKLSALLDKPVVPLNPEHGVEKPLEVALIDESRCIGCTLCIQACPVDAIVGASKAMHTVLNDWCTGCELCIVPCPVDCITMVPATPARAWGEADATLARSRYLSRNSRLRRAADARDAKLAAQSAPQTSPAPATHANTPGNAKPTTDDSAQRKRAIIAAAIARAQAQKAALAESLAAHKPTA